MLLAAAGPGKWRLPGFLSEHADPNSIESVLSGVKQVMGLELPFIVLRQVNYELIQVERPNLTATISRSIILVDINSSEELCFVPQGYEWVPIIQASGGEIIQVSNLEKEAWHAVREGLEQVVKGYSAPGRVPCAHRGWYEKTYVWVQRVLDVHGIRVIGPLAQVRASSRGVVLKITKVLLTVSVSKGERDVTGTELEFILQT